MNIKQSWLKPLLWCLTAVALTAASCDDDEDNNTTDNMYTLKGEANSAQETPTRVNTAATGNLTGTYDKNANVLQYTISWNGLEGGNPTGMHFHGPAYPGKAAGVLIPITGFPATASGSHTGTANLTDEQETDMLDGKWYYNIHNATYPGGEIRGQVFAVR